MDAAAIETKEDFLIRLLEKGDYDRGFLELLAQLTTAGSVSRQDFHTRFDQMKQQKDTYFVVVIEDCTRKLIVATATLMIEWKFIHNCGKVGHVEDVVVNQTYRGKNLGLRVVEELNRIAKQLGCYKIILDCSVANVPFYNRLGYVEKERQMALYFDK